MFKTRQKFGDDFLTIVHLLVLENTVRKIVKFDQIEHFGLSQKAALVSNFCLIGKIHQNFLVPRMIELSCKTFMPIQTLLLHVKKVNILSLSSVRVKKRYNTYIVDFVS